MDDARSSFQTLVLGSGKVLAVGGRGREGGALASSELFDPTSDSWTRQGDMHQGRAYFAAAELVDGRVVAAGGKDESGQNLNSTEVSQCSVWHLITIVGGESGDDAALLLEGGAAGFMQAEWSNAARC